MVSLQLGYRVKNSVLCALAVLACVLPSPRVQAQDIIANTGVPLESLSINLARAIFAGRMRTWPDGTPVKIFVMRDRDPLHLAFCKNTIDVFPRQLRRSWDRVIYSGVGEGPIIVRSEEEMVTRVAGTPGAVGYVWKAPADKQIDRLNLE